MKKNADRRKARAIRAAVKQLRVLDSTLEAAGAPVAACLVCEARLRIVDHYRQIIERRLAR